MKILLAEDEVTTRRILSAVLVKWGFEVIEAADGEEAWRLLSSPGGPPLALIDWIMPGLTGIELCRRLRASGRVGLPYIILLTARTEHRDPVTALDAGADTFIAKPFDPEVLRASIGAARRLVSLQLELNESNQQLDQRVRERTAQVERLLRHQRELLQRLGHDLRTPLTPLIALLPLLQETAESEDRREMLSLALAGARSVSATVNRVLELCRIDNPARELTLSEAGLRDLIDDTLDSGLCAGRRDHRTIANEVPATVRVKADLLGLRQVLGHVLDNAVKFTAPTGHITIQAATQERTVLLAVTDDGVGLEAPQLEHIFEPFYKADPSRHEHGAPGLGLTISRAIIERQGGRMWAESPGPGYGLSLRFTLPATN